MTRGPTWQGKSARVFLGNLCFPLPLGIAGGWIVLSRSHRTEFTGSRKYLLVSTLHLACCSVIPQGEWRARRPSVAVRAGPH